MSGVNGPPDALPPRAGQPGAEANIGASGAEGKDARSLEQADGAPAIAQTPPAELSFASRADGTAGRIAPHHVEMLRAAAIDEGVIARAGVRSVMTASEVPEAFRSWKPGPGLIFPWHSVSRRVVEQFRPDEPVKDGDKVRKYLFPTGSGNVLNVHPDMTARLANPSRVVIVEGTKQYLAAVSAAPDGVAVVGIAGCYGWSSGGKPIEDMGLIRWTDAHVTVIFDADIATNHNVHEAGRRLDDELRLRGAAKIDWVQIPGGATTGLDDVLAERRSPNQTTTEVFGALLASAGRLPRRPPVKKKEAADDAAAAKFFDANGSLRVVDLYEALRAEHHLAVDRSGRLLVYRDGVYEPDITATQNAVVDLLGNRYRPGHYDNVSEVAVARLTTERRVIDDEPHLIVNLTNGLLDTHTGQLHPHTPDHLSIVQFPVAWDPTAKCPVFDAWLDEVAPGQSSDLLEVTSAIVDPGRRQPKALFLDGPTRSGKSTFQRVVSALVGKRNASAVTLHDLVTSKWHAAELYLKTVNLAADNSGVHIDDLSAFKRITGDDEITGERKNQHPFKFTNRAVLIFSANAIPTVGEVSGAYLARIWPVSFPRSYVGQENPAVEDAIMAELPGILVRLVEAAQRFRARGSYPAGVPAVHERFAQHSDRVRLFLAECTRPAEDSESGGTEYRAFEASDALYRAFDRWASDGGRRSMGRNKFLEAVETAGVRRGRQFKKSTGKHGFRFISLLDDEEWGQSEAVAAFAASSPLESDPEKTSALAEALRVAADATSQPISTMRQIEREEKEGEEEKGPYKSVDREPAKAATPRAGHHPVACDQCGEPKVIDVGPRLTGALVWPPCSMTPGCPGRHRIPSDTASETVPTLDPGGLW